ncbi:unnamed protein product [Closterium sp. NIES-53]
MHSRLLISGLPRSLPTLPPLPAPPCLPCVEGRQRAAPHSSSFPPRTAPLQTLHMDVWGPARVSRQGRERYFLLVVDEYSRYTMVFPLHSKGEVPDVLIPWIRAVRLQLREQFRQDLPVLRLHSDRGAPHWLSHGVRSYLHDPCGCSPFSVVACGPVGDASVFRVWGSHAFVRDSSADKLCARAIPYVFLGFPLDVPGWQFYHPTSRRVFPSQDLMFDESVPFYRLFTYRSAPPPPPPLFLAPYPLLVDPLPAEGPAPSAEPGGAEPEGAGSKGARSRGAEPVGAEPEGVELGDAESEGAESGGAEPQGTASSGGPAGATPRLSPRPEPLSPQEMCEWFAPRTRLWTTSLGGAGVSAGASGTVGAAAAGPGGARTRGTGAAGTGSVGGAGGAGGVGAGGPAEPGGAGARGGGTSTGGAGAGAGDTGAVDTGAGGAGAGGAVSGGTGAGGNVQPIPFFVPLLRHVLSLPSSCGLPPSSLSLPPHHSQPRLQPDSPLPAPSPYTARTDSFIERREPASRPASLVRLVHTNRRVPRLCPPIPGTYAMALPSPTISRVLASVVTDPSFESTVASALVAELVDIAIACRLDYATALVAESESANSPSVAGECALGTGIHEDRQEDLECLAVAVPHLVAMLLALEGDPDAPDIPTPRSYTEAITGPYSSLWQTAMDAEMASWKSTGTYVDAVPSPQAPRPLGLSVPTATTAATATAATAAPAAPACCTAMASHRVLAFDHEGRPVQFDTWLDDLQLYLLSDSKDSDLLFDLASGATPAPPATADSATRSQWLPREAAARLAIRNHLPLAECAHFGQHRHLEDLVSHLRTSNACYCATVPAEFHDWNQPPIFITLYFIVTRLPNSLRSVKDHFLSLHPTSLTVDLLEQHLLAAETSAVAVGAATGTPRPPFFEGCSPSPLAPSYASTAAAVVCVAEDVGAASAMGKGGRGGGGGSGGGGGGSRSGGGGSSGGGGGNGGGGSGGSGGGGGGVGGGGGGSSRSGGSGGGGTGARHGGFGGGQRQQQQLRSETRSPQQLREWLFQRGTSGGSDSCPYVIRTGVRAGQTCLKLHTQYRCFSRLDDAWRAEFGDDVKLPRWADLLGSRIAIFDLDFDAILFAMYALSVSAEGDYYRCVPPDPSIGATALGASESGTLPGTTPSQALHTFTLDSGASRCFFRESTTLTPLHVRLADPSGGPVVARSLPVPPYRRPRPHCVGRGRLVSEFYHPTSRRVLPSQDVTFDESVPFYRLLPYRSAPPPPPPLFLAHGPPPVDPLLPQGPAPSGAALGAASGGAAFGGAKTGVAGSEGAKSGSAEPGGEKTRGAEPEGVEPGGAESEGSESGGAEPRVIAAAGPGGARTRGAGAARTGGVGGTGAGDPTEPGAARAGGSCAGEAGAGGAGAGGARVGGTGAGGAGAAGAGAVDPGAGGAGGTVRPRLYFVPLHQQSGGLTERREPASRPVLPVRTARRIPRSRPRPVLGTHAMALRPFSVPLRVPLPAPPESSLPEVPDPESDRARAASPIVSHLLANAVTNPSFESAAASALVAELLDFAAACRLDYATALVAESESSSPPFIAGECALGTDVLEDRQEDFECLAAAVPGFVSMLLALEGDPDAPNIPTPRSYAEAITGPYSSHWQASLNVEMASWKSTGTYVDEVPQPGANIVDGMWIFRWGFQRPVYGLRQVPREWHDTLRTTLAALGFAPATAELTLFLRTNTSLPPFCVPVYIDDLVFATADTEALTLVKSVLQKRHTCTGLGELRSNLDLQITWDRARRTITLTESHMVHKVLHRFGFQFSSPQPTPLSTSHSLSAPPSDESVEPSGPYPELVGCLMYMMTCTRPDLAYPLSLLARYVAPRSHQKVHWDAAKRVLRYLCCTSGMGRLLGGRGLVVLNGHADASWVDDSATQRSSQGYTFCLGSGSVSWRSTRSFSVLSFSCEAEIYAGAMAAQELCWLTYLLTYLGEQPRSPPVLYVDNKAMIALCQEHRREHRTKHIALRYFLARELQQRGQLRLAYVATRANSADIFTKALLPGDHQRFSTVLGLVSTLPHLLTA